MLTSTLERLPVLAGLVAATIAAPTASAQRVDIDIGQPWIVQCRQDQGLQGPRMAQCAVRSEAQGVSETGQNGTVRIVASVVLGRPVITVVGPPGLLNGASVDTATATFEGVPAEIITADRCVGDRCLFEGDTADTLIAAMQRFDRMTTTLVAEAGARRSLTASFGLGGFRGALTRRAELMAR